MDAHRREVRLKRWRLGTFNLENLDDRGAGEAGFADRLAVLRPQLRRLRADVLCLQEVNAHTIDGKHGPRTPAGLDRLLEGTDYARYHRLISMNRGGRRPADHHNLVILSRFPIRDHGQVWHDLVPPPAIRPVTALPVAEQAQAVEWDRPILHASLDLGHGRLVQVVNVHLRAPRAAWLPGQKTEHGRWLSVGGWAEGFYLAAVKRAGQALEARLLVEKMFDADPLAQVVVCGDFNCDDHEAPLRTLMGDEEDTGNGHLAPRMLVPAERSVSESQRFTVIHHGRKVMLDHVLLSRPLLGDLIGCEIHNEALGDELVSPARIWQPPDSYHAPMVVELT